MKTKIIVGFLILLVIFVSPVFAQDSLISVKTDSSSYKEGNVIVVSGNVKTVVGDTPVLLQFITQETIVQIAQITVAQDGSFSTTINAEGPKWNKEGQYIIRASYGDGNIAEAEFNYKPKTTAPDQTQTFEVNAGSFGTFDVEYSIIGGIVKDIKIDPDNFALIIMIEASEKGSLLIEVPREALDAKKQDRSDEVFIILIDGVEALYQENVTDFGLRSITINFEKNDSEIKIIGTTIIPEFGSLTFLILMIGIITAIVVGKKTNFIAMSRV